MMNVDRLNHWLMVVANLRVLAGILFLAYEIRQNTSQMRSEASYTITELVHSLNADTYRDSELAELFLRGNENFNSLDPIERYRYGQLQFSRISLAEYILKLEGEGLNGLQFNFVEVLAFEIQNNPGSSDWLNSIEASWQGSEKLWEILSTPK